MKKGEIEHMNQLLSTLEESVKKLEIYHEKNDSVNFEKTKKFTLNLFSKLSESIK